MRSSGTAGAAASDIDSEETSGAACTKRGLRGGVICPHRHARARHGHPRPLKQPNGKSKDVYGTRTRACPSFVS